MILPTQMSGKTIGILGLSRSGVAVARALAEVGATIFGHDDHMAANHTLPQSIEIIDPATWPWDHLDALVISPGIPHLYPKPHPVAAMATANQVPIISDIELLIKSNPQAKIIGITGTNGKSTVVTLIDHILKSNKVKTALGGNIGIAALSLEDPGADGVIILELSSYQLETTPSLKLDAGAVINITPDHLDRHGGWDGYVAAKSNLIKAVKSEGITVLGPQDEVAHLSELAQSMVKIADPDALAELKKSVSLNGPHNALNMAIAIDICRHLGLEDSQIFTRLETFKGLPHRMEHIGNVNGIQFINDSKATNGDAAAEALKSFQDIYWIAGGSAKDDGLGIAAEHVNHVRRAFMIGSSAEQFADQIRTRVSVEISGDINSATESALQAAFDDNLDNATILLSPAAASFDQFDNFEARGECFRSIVQNLIDAHHGESCHD